MYSFLTRICPSLGRGTGTSVLTLRTSGPPVSSICTAFMVSGMCGWEDIVRTGGESWERMEDRRWDAIAEGMLGRARVRMLRARWDMRSRVLRRVKRIKSINNAEWRLHELRRTVWLQGSSKLGVVVRGGLRHWNWRISNSLPKRPVLIFTKKTPKPRRALVRLYNLHLPASSGYKRHISKDSYAFLYEDSFIRRSRASFSCSDIKDYLVIGHFERFFGRSLVTLSICTLTNNAARVEFKDRV